MSNRNPRQVQPHFDGTSGISGVILSGRPISFMDLYGLKRVVGEVIAHETTVATSDWAPLTRKDVERICATSPALFRFVTRYQQKHPEVHVRYVALRVIDCVNESVKTDHRKILSKSEKIEYVFKTMAFIEKVAINLISLQNAS